MKTKLFFTGLALFAITSFAFSQNSNSQQRPGRGQCNHAGWIDENTNRKSDYNENAASRQGSVNGGGNGYCQVMSQGSQEQRMMNKEARGRNFTDENKDGVCDRFQDAQKAPAGQK